MFITTTTTPIILPFSLEQCDRLPEKQGKALSGKLKGYRSVRALGQRYRIVYRVERSTITVLIVGAGIRKEGIKKDIYAI
ncbi:MAG: hypothetical protein QNJ72_05225 [Pleurocapsa sp. MO_226.B13]|nr:hypothetical protein [Pleurocapsa sp. MO_226.B13]